MHRIFFSLYLNPARRFALAALAVLLIANVVWLIEDQKPWNSGVAERLAEGRKIRVKDYRLTWLWYAGAASAATLATLMVGLPLWLRPLPPAPRSVLNANAAVGKPRVPPPSWLTFAALLALLAAAAADRLPRLDHSLWNDEEYSKRSYIHGTREPDAPDGDALHFKGVTWEEALYRNHGSNNHVAFSVLARAALGAWRVATGHTSDSWNEAAFRIVPLALGLATLPALAWFGASCGAPVTGLFAAAWLAFHPWHVRYAVEGRGYAQMMFFLVLTLGVLVHALHKQRWVWWAAYGTFQFAYMLSFPGAVYAAAAMNVFAVSWLLWVSRKGGWNLWDTLPRLIVANMVSAIAFLWVYAPSIPQVAEYLARDLSHGQMGWEWARDIWAHGALGIHWSPQGPPGTHRGISIAEYSAEHPWLAPAVLYGLAVLLLAGILRLAARRAVSSVTIAVGMVAPIFAFLHLSLQDNFLLSWYLIYTLPALCWVWAKGALALTSLPGRFRVVGIAFAVCVLAGWIAVTQPVRERLGAVPRQPMREAVALTRPNGEPASRIMTVAFGTSAEQIGTYDPWAHPIDGDKPEELREYIRLASSSGRILRVYICGLLGARRTEPTLTSMVADSPDFVEIGRLPGFEEMFSYHVYEYTGGSDGRDPPG